MNPLGTKNTYIAAIPNINKKVPIRYKEKGKDVKNKAMNPVIDIDKQVLLAETEDILALIYRSYWATPKELLEFSSKDNQELKQFEEKQKDQYKDVSEIFGKRKKINKVILDNSLMVIPKENFIQKLFKKILKLLKH